MANLATKFNVLRDINLHKKEQWENLEKILISIVASGFLGGSLALISGSKTGIFIHIRYLVISWIAFGAGLIFLILSYVVIDLADGHFIRKINKKK